MSFPVPRLSGWGWWLMLASLEPQLSWWQFQEALLTAHAQGTSWLKLHQNSRGLGIQLSAGQFPGIHQVPHSISDLTKHHRTKPTSEDNTLPYYFSRKDLLYNGFRMTTGLLTAVLAPQKVSVQGPARAEINSASRYPVVDDHKESISIRLLKISFRTEAMHPVTVSRNTTSVWSHFIFLIGKHPKNDLL